MSGEKRKRPIRPYAEIQRLANKAVTHAVRSGALPRLGTHGVTDIPCVDCGAIARCYDHRDYSKPLEVDPVCRSCNELRGPAIDIAHLITKRSKRASSN